MDGRLGQLLSTWHILRDKNLTHVAANMGRLTVKRDWPSIGVFFKHFYYFECTYEPIISSGCSMLLGVYLEGVLGSLP